MRYSHYLHTSDGSMSINAYNDPSRTKHSTEKVLTACPARNALKKKTVREIRRVRVPSGETCTDQTRCKSGTWQTCTADPRDTEHQCKGMYRSNTVYIWLLMAKIHGSHTVYKSHDLVPVILTGK